MKNSNRIVFIDYVRVIACFLVMLVHASENFYCISADTTMLANESNRFWVAFYDGALGRMSVPLCSWWSVHSCWYRSNPMYP